MVSGIGFLYMQSYVGLMIYDLEDIKNPKMIHKIQLELSVNDLDYYI